MRPRFLFRPRSRAIRTTSPNLGPVFPVLAVLAFLGLYTLMQYLDDADAAELAQAVATRSADFEAGRLEGQRQIMQALEEGGVGVAFLPREGCANLGLVRQERP